MSQNPGPVKWPCCMCGKAVAKHHRAVQCDQCDKWCHTGERCENVKPVDYQKLIKDASNSLKWYCPMPRPEGGQLRVRCSHLHMRQYFATQMTWWAVTFCAWTKFYTDF